MSVTKSQEINEMKNDMSLLKKDIEVIGKYFDKLDTTVEKISELTTSMHRMIALHEERIGVQATADSEMRQLIEARRKETEEGFRSIEKKIDSAIANVATKLEEANDRIWKLDLKRGAMVGGIIVISFVLGPILNGYFQALFGHVISLKGTVSP